MQSNHIRTSYQRDTREI